MTAENRRQDYLNDITSNIGSAFLGLTIGCARCHDHKFDPILQEDFYRLQAFFTPLQRATLSVDFLPAEQSPAMQRRYQQTVARRLGKIKQLRAELQVKIAKAQDVSVDKITDAILDQAIQEKKHPITEADTSQLNALQTDKKHLIHEQRFESKAIGVRNPQADEVYPPTFLLNNGDPFDPAEKIVPGYLSSAPVWSQEFVNQTHASDGTPGGRRKKLATWLPHPHNPITSRALVNRIWHYHFGAGLVATPNDLGENGAGPSHPWLLDYLAHELQTNGWHLKPLHYQLVLSRAYRSAAFHPHAASCAQVDPDNRLLWRASYRRLESEVIRDAILAVSGQLQFEMSGPGFFEVQPDGMRNSYPFFIWKPSVENQRRRRSIYMFQRRNLVHPFMETFDSADLNLSCEQREKSITASQALSLFNSRFAYENSLHLATRLREQRRDDGERVKWLFRLALARPPTDREHQVCVTFYDKSGPPMRKHPAQESLKATPLPALSFLRCAISVWQSSIPMNFSIWIKSGP